MATSAGTPSNSPRLNGSAPREASPQGKQTLTDKDLVVAYQKGERDAYEAIYNRHSERVRRICYRMLGNKADADEAVQETFLRTYKALGRFNGQYQLGAWVSRIASNVCLDQLRQRGRTVQTQDVDDEVLELASKDKLPDLVVEQQIDVAESLRCIQPLHARALMLRAVAGLSHQEMAGELEMTPEQVKSLLHRARSSFRRAWDQASGWALAPLVFKLPFSKKQSARSGDGLDLLLASPATSTLFERVATSAVIAALALTGAGVVETNREQPSAAQPVATPEVEVPGKVRKVVLAPHRRPTFETQGSTEKASTVARQAPAAQQPAPKEEGEALVAAGDVIVEKPENPVNPGDDGELEPPSGPGTSAGNDVQRKVEEVITAAKKALKVAPELSE